MKHTQVKSIASASKLTIILYVFIQDTHIQWRTSSYSSSTFCSASSAFSTCRIIVLSSLVRKLRSKRDTEPGVDGVGTVSIVAIIKDQLRYNRLRRERSHNISEE